MSSGVFLSQKPLCVGHGIYIPFDTRHKQQRGCLRKVMLGTTCKLYIVYIIYVNEDVFTVFMY